jgi:homoserine O-acetyltransferase/O-succinyltransferase
MRRIGRRWAAVNGVATADPLGPYRSGMDWPTATGIFEIPELRLLASAELRPIPSIWGHRAGNPEDNPEDFAFLRAAVRDWLER